MYNSYFVNRLPSQNYNDVRYGKRDVHCGNRDYIKSSLGYRGRRKIKQHVFGNMTWNGAIHVNQKHVISLI